ncbi:MAG: transposase domain-containing protein [Erysipelotrichaceae bacterium]|nr:transposase domain-containing protein [Erysipelotrichaceae bacterium]
MTLFANLYLEAWYQYRKKNWTFCGSREDANSSATVYSLVETVKSNDLNPYKYLEFLLARLPGSNVKTNP